MNEKFKDYTLYGRFMERPFMKYVLIGLSLVMLLCYIAFIMSLFKNEDKTSEVPTHSEYIKTLSDESFTPTFGLFKTMIYLYPYDIVELLKSHGCKIEERKHGLVYATVKNGIIAIYFPNDRSPQRYRSRRVFHRRQICL